MAYQALYRRWRPNSFEMVVGQNATVNTLRHQVTTGKIAHAYLFCGCRGTGKTTLAKLMSRAINCKNPNNGDPCGVCEVCTAILNETTMDVMELDAASNNSVDNIRDLLQQIRYPAQMGQYKVYIIDEVHMLSTAAFNALLKTLEEPPPYVVFILATTEPQKLPATILSRVQRYEFGRIPTAYIIERLKLALDDMNFKAEDEALAIVASAAEGAMRDAFSILDMCIAGAIDDTITAEQVRSMLGTSDRSFLFLFMDSLASRDNKSAMQHINKLMMSGHEPQVFIRELTAHTRALLTVFSIQDDVTALLDITPETEKEYRKQATTFTQSYLLELLQLFTKAEIDIRHASTPRIGLEMTILRAIEQNKAEDNIGLLSRLEDAELKLNSLLSKIESGQLNIASKPTTTPKKTPERTQAPKINTPPPPTEVTEIWKQTLSKLSKTDPSLFGLMCNEKFIGEENGVFRLEIPLSKKDFSFPRLNQPARRDRIVAVLHEVTGRDVKFEAILASNENNISQTEMQDEIEKNLVDAFGRANVQIITDVN